MTTDIAASSMWISHMPADEKLGRQVAGGGRGVSSREETHPPRSYDTAELFGADTEIEIVHQHVVYRLKITRQGKLILNK